MSRAQMDVLDCINRHPEGIITSDIVDEMFPAREYWDRVCIRNRTHRYCKVLLKYGMVRQLVASNGTPSVWAPADY